MDFVPSTINLFLTIECAQDFLPIKNVELIYKKDLSFTETKNYIGRLKQRSIKHVILGG